MPQDDNRDAENVNWFSLVDETPLDDDVSIEGYQLDYPQVTFQESLAAIQADALAPQDLLGFAGMNRKMVHEVRAVWTKLPDERRATIAEILLMVAREYAYADFGRMFPVLLADPLTEVRLQGATGAVLSEDTDLIEPLHNLAMNDADLTVREAAILALAPHMVALDIGDAVLDRKDQRRLRSLKDWAQDASLPAAIRAASLQVYSHWDGDDDTGAIIEQFVETDDETLNLGAMRAMAQYGAERFTRFLERQMQSPDVDTREAAAAAMGNSGDEAVVPMLTMLARTDSEPAVREAAFVALANQMSEAALKSLIQLRENASDDEIEIIDGCIAYIQEWNEIEGEDDILLDDDEDY